MTKKLTIHNAEILTASVEIKTLTVSGKQVTQGVFKQLREEPLISEDGTLNGVPWGYVNYHADKCEKSPIKHLHVVWQQGTELLRSPIALVPTFDYPGADDSIFYPEFGTAFLTACVRAVLHGEQVKYFNGHSIPRRRKYNHISGNDETVPMQDRRATSHGLSCFMEMTDKAFAAVGAAERLADARKDAEQEAEKARTGGQVYTYARDALLKREAQFVEALRAVDEECDSDPSIDVWYQKYDAEVKGEAERRQRHRDVRAAIAELPHLFIAV